jgi:hypothetical protein
MPGRHVVVIGELGELTSKANLCPMNSKIAYLYCNRCEVAGLNKIFGCRADDPVQYESEVHKAFAEKSQTMEIPKKVPQCPDRIYGLRLTRNIENLLYDTANAEVYNINDNTEPLQVHEILDPSPFKRPLIQTGDPLLFPFLVLEAKSGKSTDDWLSIQMQTAFPIRSFLQAQDAPRRAAGTRSVWKTSPLVWFFANRGDDWRLSAGFIQKGQENPHTRGNVDYVSKFST